MESNEPFVQQSQPQTVSGQSNIVIPPSSSKGNWIKIILVLIVVFFIALGTMIIINNVIAPTFFKKPIPSDQFQTINLVGFDSDQPYGVITIRTFPDKMIWSLDTLLPDKGAGKYYQAWIGSGTNYHDYQLLGNLAKRGDGSLYLVTETPILSTNIVTVLITNEPKLDSEIGIQMLSAEINLTTSK
jgi:hypothetical protein